MLSSITKNITIEELVENVPQSVKYLTAKGIKCIACGEPIWGTLEEAAKEKGYSDEEIGIIIGDLQKLADDETGSRSQIHIKKMNDDINRAT